MEKTRAIRRRSRAAILLALAAALSLTWAGTAFAATSRDWRWPTDSKSYGSGYPCYSSGKFHGGTDIPVPVGTPVYATCDLDVVYTKTLTDSYGKHIVLVGTVEGELTYFWYAHLSEFAVSDGQEVSAGQLIGYSGSTGNSTGPHLHYEVRDSSNSHSAAHCQDPSDYMPGSDFEYELNHEPVYPSPSNGHDPVGNFELVLSGSGSVCVAGWAKDPDDEAAQIDLNVYIGGAAGQPGTEGHWIKANLHRDDVGTHSFHSWISVGKEGIQEVFVYAINVGEGGNTFLGTKTVNIPSGNPDGCVDSIEGDYGKIRVQGWAFDPSDSSASITVHVYIGGAAGTGEGHAIVADQLREDVNAAYGISGKHGFDVLLETEKRGNQDVYVYAINIGSGTDHACIGKGSVNIKSDTSPPTISSVSVQGISYDGYTISCKVTDNVGVSRVTFPTWTVANGQDDLLSGREFDDGYAGVRDGDTWTFRVKVSDHGGERGKYLTHIYAWNAVGNRAKLGDEGRTITEVPAKPVSSCAVTLSPPSCAYDGAQKSPKVTVKDGSATLAEGTHYTVEWPQGRTAAGTYTVKVTGRGNYSGTKTATFTIEESKLEDGWVDLGGGKKGYRKDGKLVTGWMDLGSSKYWFGTDNAMSVGWTDVVADGKTFHNYFNPASGNLVRDTWFEIDGRKYYFRPSGNVAHGWATISDNGKAMRYYFRPSGSMAIGWASIDGEKYYFRDSSNMATGFTTVSDGYERYFDKSGHMLTGWQVMDGKTFYFRIPSGAMQTDWAAIDGREYEFTDSGTIMVRTVVSQTDEKMIIVSLYAKGRTPCLIKPALSLWACVAGAMRRW